MRNQKHSDALEYNDLNADSLNHAAKWADLNAKANDSVNGQINDLVNDPVNLTAGYYYANDLSDFDLLLLKTIHENPGFRVPGLLKLMESKDGSATSDRIKNSIRRKLKDYVEYSGAMKNRGYYLKGC